jgi:hypothetical protein
MRAILRTTYRGLLWMHPVEFREEFGAEMLWIFDEECSRGAALPLLFDGLRSFVVQNARPRLQQQQAVAAAGPFYIEIDSTIPAERIANLWLISISCTLSLCLFMSMIVPNIAMPLGRMLYAHMQIFSSTPEQAQTKDLSSTHQARHSTHR